MVLQPKLIVNKNHIGLTSGLLFYKLGYAWIAGELIFY